MALREKGKGNAKGKGAKALNVGIGSRLLCAEIITRKAQHNKTIVLVAPPQVL
jgi:hypothetical protein